MQATAENRSSWLDRPLFNSLAINAETIIYVIIMVLAVISRFYALDARVMSHDENSHVYYSWRLYQGQGFAHDPLMHGPFQFIFIALSYFMFGDNDFTARILAAVCSIAAVGFMWAYRRYFGRAGALIAAALMLISPYMLYYGRYVRNEAYVALFGVVTIWAILRYLETGQAKYMYWLTAATALHFTAKETSFIYTAQALVFLGFYFIYRITNASWKHPQQRNLFLIALIAALLLVGGTGIVILSGRDAQPEMMGTVEPVVPGQELTPLEPSGPSALLLTLVILGLIALVVAAYFLIRGFTWKGLQSERSFGLIVLLATLVLPQLAAFPVDFVGWTVPTNATQVIGLTTIDILRIALFLVPLAVISAVVGILWNRREWLINAAIFYAIFIIFYTTIFTNGAGFFTGLVGSLGYWLEQQAVNRGSQPWYYYLLTQVPVYEFLALLGTILAFIIFFVRKPAQVGAEENDHEGEVELSDEEEAESEIQPAPVFPLLGFWAVSSFIVYTVAGEKMPWLTVHIALPMILCTAWALGQVVDNTDWGFFSRRGWLVVVLLPIFYLSLASTLRSLLGAQPPFSGQQLDQLQATSTFITSLLTAIFSGVGLFYLLKSWPWMQVLRVGTLMIFAFLGFLTARTAIQAAYINHDYANELLVYAHSAPGVKLALAQVEEISRRTTDGLAIPVAYDNATSYPYWWYLRNYSDARYFGADPTRSLRDAPAILVGDENFGKIEPVVGQAYHQFDYIRLWWPNEDYKGLTWERIQDALTNPQMREALFQIWLNRDYTKYGEVTNKDLSSPNWSPASRMRLYIRKDIVSQLWNYGAAPSEEAIVADPFEDKEVTLQAERVIGEPGNQPGQFQGPRDLEIASDGSLYIADSNNHRIQHLTPDGEVLHVWGSFADAAAGSAPAGTFNQPWGLGIGPDGAVYVADTWNHRVQKFSSEGEFLNMWGFFGQAESPDAFWGPRDVAVNAEGHVFVTDTGNKRVVVFDSDGNFITEFGSAGMTLGQFDEPVGVTVDGEGRVYVADTWNQRVQMFGPAQGSYAPVTYWDVVAWFGQSLENKPYLAVDNQGSVFASDPEGYRVLQFTNSGEPVRFWGDFSTGLDGFGLAASVAVDSDGNVWVSDAGNHRIMYFVLSNPAVE